MFLYLLEYVVPNLLTCFYHCLLNSLPTKCRHIDNSSCSFVNGVKPKFARGFQVWSLRVRSNSVARLGSHQCIPMDLYNYSNEGSQAEIRHPIALDSAKT